MFQRETRRQNPKSISLTIFSRSRLFGNFQAENTFFLIFFLSFFGTKKLFFFFLVKLFSSLFFHCHQNIFSDFFMLHFLLDTTHSKIELSSVILELTPENPGKTPTLLRWKNSFSFPVAAASGQREKYKNLFRIRGLDTLY
jgi:hypothetical protein